MRNRSSTMFSNSQVYGASKHQRESCTIAICRFVSIISADGNFFNRRLSHWDVKIFLYETMKCDHLWKQQSIRKMLFPQWHVQHWLNWVLECVPCFHLKSLRNSIWEHIASSAQVLTLRNTTLTKNLDVKCHSAKMSRDLRNTMDPWKRVCRVKLPTSGYIVKKREVFVLSFL